MFVVELVNILLEFEISSIVLDKSISILGLKRTTLDGGITSLISSLSGIVSVVSFIKFILTK